MIQIRIEVLAAAVLGIVLGFLVAKGSKRPVAAHPGESSFIPEAPGNGIEEAEAVQPEPLSIPPVATQSGENVTSSRWEKALKWMLRILLVVLTGMSQ